MSKLILSLAAAMALAATAALPGFAQDAAKSAVQIPKDTFYAGQGKNQFLAKQRLLGQKVVNTKGQAIGDITDLIVNESNQIEGVIVHIAGTLGAKDKNIGVQLKALKIEAKDGKTTVSLPAGTPEVLGALQPYKRTEPAKK